jgi:hypothetical protein
LVGFGNEVAAEKRRAEHGRAVVTIGDQIPLTLIIGRLSALRRSRHAIAKVGNHSMIATQMGARGRKFRLPREGAAVD